MRQILLAAAGFTICLVQPAGAGNTSTQLYILAGQSNMSGHGALAELTEQERAPDPLIRLFGNDGAWKVAREPLDDDTGQVDAVSADARARVGPGLFFARRLRALSGARIDVLPCAKGGSAIDQWAPATRRDTLYGSCAARIAEAKARPAGMLWYQGEADTRSLASANGWQAKFIAMVTQLRRDLKTPKMPVVLVQLADRDMRPEIVARRPGWEIVQSAQQSLAMDCVATVSAKGLKLNPDRLHLATEGQRILGQRLADAMHALRRRGCG